MNNRDLKIELGAVQSTLLFPLWARAKETEKKNPVLVDAYAKDILAKIDYDFLKFETGAIKNHQLVWPIRAYNFDNTVREFLSNNPKALIVNIGAGLDTTSRRIDNGTVLWINIDLPDVVSLRQKLIPDSDREMTVAKSVFDFTWIEDIAMWTKECSVLFVAAGVLLYFEPSKVKALFLKLAEVYPGAKLVFDSMPRFIAKAANWEIRRKGLVDSMPPFKWYLKKASQLKKWSNTISVIGEYPMFSRIPICEDWDWKMKLDMKIADLFHMYNMTYVQL